MLEVAELQQETLDTINQRLGYQIKLELAPKVRRSYQWALDSVTHYPDVNKEAEREMSALQADYQRYTDSIYHHAEV